MKRALSFVAALGALACGFAAGGCGASRSGGQGGVGGAAGIGGGAPGQGGATGTGGGAANGGSTGTDLSGTGGRATGGSGTGGTPSGTGGTLSGFGGKSSGMGGTMIAGTGGRVTGGAGTGGVPTGGTTTIDAGAADAMPAKCSEIGDQAACDLRNDCHSVFDDPGTCGCATPGCCARFQACADGATADCVGPATCKMMTPRCEDPYVVAFSGACYEGCVRKVECTLPNCPQAAPKDGVQCENVDHACFYEDCAGAGRTSAVCSGGTWKVDTGACTSFECPGGGITPQPQTCTAGQLCVSTTSGGGAYWIMPACVDHSCGKGPLSLACVSGASGACTAAFSLAGTVIKCQEPFIGAP